MAKIQTSCPNCNQPLVADVYQVVDVTREPQMKELLLAGGLNIAQCQVCGFQGQLPVPLVYHDKDKELLLTFFPPDSNKTMEEKEASLAPLLKQVTDRLDPEDKKGYLFQPQTMLTMNNLVKNVLMADGITEEMIQDQQEKMKLLDQFFNLSGEAIGKSVKENAEKIDREFFALFAEIAQRIIAGGDEKSIEKVKEVQDALMAETEVGQEIFKESQEIQAATKSLEALGKNLTRSSLLELIIGAPNQERVKALAGLVRPAMDYEFFQLFTDRIEATDEDNRKEMVERRNILLKVTQEIDQEIENRVNQAVENIDRIIESESIEESLIRNINLVDQLFVQALAGEIQKSENAKDEARLEKLNKLLGMIQELSTPPELKLLEGLLEAVEDESKLDQMLNELDDESSGRLTEYLTSLISGYEDRSSVDGEDEEQIAETLEKLKEVFNTLLRISMEKKMG